MQLKEIITNELSTLTEGIKYFKKSDELYRKIRALKDAQEDLKLTAREKADIELFIEITKKFATKIKNLEEKYAKHDDKEQKKEIKKAWIDAVDEFNRNLKFIRASPLMHKMLVANIIVDISQLAMFGATYLLLNFIPSLFKDGNAIHRYDRQINGFRLLLSLLSMLFGRTYFSNFVYKKMGVKSKRDRVVTNIDVI